MASVFVAIALVVEYGVMGLSAGINKALSLGIFSPDGLILVGMAVLQLIPGIALAIAAIYLALKIIDKLTRGVEEFEELKKGNVAVALENGRCDHCRGRDYPVGGNRYNCSTGLIIIPFFFPIILQVQHGEWSGPF